MHNKDTGVCVVWMQLGLWLVEALKFSYIHKPHSLCSFCGFFYMRPKQLNYTIYCFKLLVLILLCFIFILFCINNNSMKSNCRQKSMLVSLEEWAGSCMRRHRSTGTRTRTQTSVSENLVIYLFCPLCLLTFLIISKGEISSPTALQKCWCSVLN